MPKVTQYTPNQISPTVVQQPRSNIQPADYSPIAKGLSDIGKATGDMVTRIDTTSAESALINFEREKNDIFFNPKSGYFNTQGRNAYDNAATVSSAVVELKKKYGKDLNENSRLMFDRVAEKHITQANNDIMQHSSKGLQAWEVATIESQVENTLENASLYWNQPEKLRVQRALGEQAIIDSSKITGIGSEATNEKLQTFRSAFVGGTIDAAIMKSSSDGQKMLDEHGDLLEGPAKMKLQKTIETKKEAEKTKFDAEQAVLTAGRIVNDFDNRNDIINEVNKIKDPELQQKTMSQAIYLFNQKKIADGEDRADIIDAIEKYNGSVTQFQAENPKAWNTLSGKQQQTLLAGGNVVTDDIYLSKLLLMSDKEKAELIPSDHFYKVGGADRDKLNNAVLTSRKVVNGVATVDEKQKAWIGTTRTKRTNEAASRLFGGITPSKQEDWKDTDHDAYNTFYSLVNNEVSYREGVKGRDLTLDEFDNVLAGITRDVVIKRGSVPGIFKALPILYAEINVANKLRGDKTMTAEKMLKEIPQEDIPIIVNELRNRKLSITSKNIMSLYKQGNK